MRTIEWDDRNQEVRMIDQRVLPSRLTHITCSRYQEIIQTIQNMSIRGAPAIGIAGAFGVVLAALQVKSNRLITLQTQILDAADKIQQSRPTAVNLRWALDRMRSAVKNNEESADGLRQALVDEAKKMAEEDVAVNKKMAEFGARLIRDGDTIIHHCNTGSLAAVDWGTALGCIRLAHEQGKKIHILVDETRPRLQGARLTAWELEQYGISYEIITDNAAGYFLEKKLVQKVMFGADRVAANGDVANKIGSYMLALAATDNHIPVYSVAPTSSFDLSIKDGKKIPIEERDPQEVLGIRFEKERIAPLHAKARNPAFDITSNRLITAFVTEKGIIKPPYTTNLCFISKG